MGKHRDWTEIRIDYQQNGLSYAKIADKYGVSIVTVKKAAKREGWVKACTKTAKAESVAKKIPAQKDTAERTPRPKLERTDDEPTGQEEKDRFLGVVRRLLDKIEASVELMPPECAKELKSLSGALKDLSTIAGWDKDENDLAEQRARIEKLRAETKAATDEASRAVTVRFVDTEGAET